MKGYCVKCRQPREIAGAHNETLPNGRAAVKGTCRECKTPMTVFVKKLDGGKT